MEAAERIAHGVKLRLLAEADRRRVARVKIQRLKALAERAGSTPEAKPDAKPEAKLAADKVFKPK